MGELKLFLSLFDINKEYALSLAKVAAELVDNASEHAESDCLIDIFVSDPVYKKQDCDEIFTQSVWLLSIFCRPIFKSWELNEKIEERDYEASERYDLVAKAFENHKSSFRTNQYESDDFFQSRILSR